jgi:hypothetical protein
MIVHLCYERLKGQIENVIVDGTLSALSGKVH